jgi:hypothetical protein
MDITTKGHIAAGRLSAQQISDHRFARPAELVAWMGAIQAQDYRSSLWAVALRLSGPPASEASIEAVLERGELLRLHGMRGTWQLMAPADARWIVGLVGPRLLASLTRRYAELSLDKRTVTRSLKAFTRALSDGAHLTRAEMGTALQRAGVAASGPRLAHLLGHAELEGLICNGGRRGKHGTFALLDGRAPGRPPTLAGPEAVAELARRYFRSRGPATLDDFRWWSGLPAAEVRAGIEAAAGTLATQVIEGRTCWLAADLTQNPQRVPHLPRSAHARDNPARGVHLLPAFDEYLVAYRNRDAVLEDRHTKKLNAGGGMLNPAVVQDGRVIGTWRRTLGRQGVAVTMTLFAPASLRLRRELAVAARRYGDFLGLTADVTIDVGR